VLWLALTNRPDAVDPALKRPGRFGDLVLEMPPLTVEAAAKIMAVYAPRGLPWWIAGEVRSDLGDAALAAAVLLPALGAVFDAVVLRYATEPQRSVEVTAGVLLSAVHFREAMSQAKLRAARRRGSGQGVAAVGVDDVVAGLVDQACAAARQMEADWPSLQRCLRVRGRIQRVDLVAPDDVAWRRDLVAQP
jgi:SpoVK/Ycf46/Vps4 family AAA+-type ATPase